MATVSDFKNPNGKPLTSAVSKAFTSALTPAARTAYLTSLDSGQRDAASFGNFLGNSLGLYSTGPYATDPAAYANSLLAQGADPNQPMEAPSVSPVAKPSSPTLGWYGGATNPKELDYYMADLASKYRMDKATAYQEALSNTAYSRAVADLKNAGLNPVLAMGKVSPADTFAGTELGSGGGGGGGRRSTSKFNSKQFAQNLGNIAKIATSAASIVRVVGMMMA